jgi:hypothetical protein
MPRKGIEQLIIEAHQGKVNEGAGLFQFKPPSKPIDTPDDQTENGIRSGSGQGQVNIRSGSGEYLTLVKSGSGQGQVSGSGSGLVTDDDNELELAAKQKIIYTWFVNNGLTGQFNKGQIQRETGIIYPTIRKCIRKLQQHNLIEIGIFNPATKLHKYKLNPEANVRTGSGSGSGSGQGQVRVNLTPYKTDRCFFNNNLSVFLENSDFWKAQGLNQQRCQKWIEDLPHCDPDMLVQQLQFAESMDLVKNADSPMDYFFKALVKGGFSRPKGFELPEERAARIKLEEVEKRSKAITELERLRQSEQEIADRESFLMFLNDKEAVAAAVSEIEKQYVTPKLKASIVLYREQGRIDSRLEIRLKQVFQSTDKTK